MPGDVGLVAGAIDTIASWFMSAGGYAQFIKRRRLRAKKEEARRALIDNDWDALRRHVVELERLSNEA